MVLEDAGQLSWLLEFAISCASWLMLVALALCFLRIARGPTLADRVVALDILNILAVAYCALLAVTSGRAIYLDVGIALALVAFLVTVAFARFIERTSIDSRAESAAEVDNDH